MTTTHTGTTPRGDEAARPLRRAARGSILNLASMVVSALATFGLTVVVTRLTTPAQAGVFFSATALFMIASGLSRLGTDTALVYFLSGARARGELRHARRYMRVAAVPVLAVSVAAGVALLLLADPLAAVVSPEEEQATAAFLRALALGIPAAGVLQLAISGSRGLGVMGPTAYLEQIARPALQLVLVLAVLLVWGPAGVSWAWAWVYLPLAVLGWRWWLRLRDRAAVQVDDPDFRPARSFWAFSWPRALASVSQVATQRLDIVLVGALAGLPEAAVYAAVTRFVALGQMVARSVSMSAEPLLGEALAGKDRRGAKDLYQSATSWVVLITWPIYLVLMIFGSTALSLFGESYTEGRQALLVLCCTLLVATACGMVNMVLLMAGKSFWNLANLLIAFGVNLVLDLLLIPRIGVLGAAIGWGVAILLINLLALGQINHWLGLHPFGRATMLAMGLCTATFVGIPGAVAALWGTGLVPLLVGGTLASAAYLALLLRLRTPLRLDLLLATRRGRGARGRSGDRSPRA